MKNDRLDLLKGLPPLDSLIRVFDGTMPAPSAMCPPVVLVSYKSRITQAIHVINPRARPFEVDLPDSQRDQFITYCSAKQFETLVAPLIREIDIQHKGIEIAFCVDRNTDRSSFYEEMFRQHLPSIINKKAVEIDANNPQATSDYAKLLINRSCNFRAY